MTAINQKYPNPEEQRLYEQRIRMNRAMKKAILSAKKTGKNPNTQDKKT
ncbi:MAG: hypothetical protein HQL25_01525 [Candidatus Omnitrophica bacterium]|nr:hypothetical protein [Candidatus Omnitrophota bacterium]